MSDHPTTTALDSFIPSEKNDAYYAMKLQAENLEASNRRMATLLNSRTEHLKNWQLACKRRNKHIKQLEKERATLEAENAGLRAALKPFGHYLTVMEVMRMVPTTGSYWACETSAGVAEITIEDLKLARELSGAALAAYRKSKEVGE